MEQAALLALLDHHAVAVPAGTQPSYHELGEASYGSLPLAGSKACLEQCIHRDCIGRYRSPLHRRKRVQSPLGVLTLLASADQGAKIHHVRLRVLSVRCQKNRCDPLELLSPLEGTDQGVEDDHVEQSALLLEGLKHLQGLLGLLAFLACADQGAVGYHSGHHALTLHCPEYLEGLHRLLALFAGADPAGVFPPSEFVGAYW